MAAPSAKSMQKAGQFTALVDILFATIGIFVIVFALQELDPPVDLLPAPYDSALVCGDDRALRLYARGAEQPHNINIRSMERDLTDLLQRGGRVLVALSADCMRDPGDGVVVADRLHDLERNLTERETDTASTLLLMEFAPLAAGEEDALIARFNSVGQGV